MQNDERKQHEEFAELMRLHEPLILHVCCTHTRYRKGKVDGRTTEDLYSDIVGELWKSWPSLQLAENKAGWIHRVAINVAAGQYRKERHMPSHVRIDRNLDTTPETEDESLITLLYGLIDKLDDMDRELIFCYLDKIPQAVIGEIMGISEDAVNKRIRRIKDKLKELNDKERSS